MRVLLAALLATAMTVPALAEDDVLGDASAFAVNNAYSALYHEFGHLFVDQFQLPILGNEEYVADAIATILLLRDETDAAYEISFDTVDGYLRSSALFDATSMEEVDFNDEHGLDLQRAAQMTCLLVGGDPDNYADLAEQMGLEAERQENCAAEYEQATKGWETLIEPHRRGGGAEGAKLEVKYDDAGADYADMADLLKQHKVLERVAEVVMREFVLERPATLKGTTCGEENAFYDPEANEVTMCYEYVRLYYDLIADPDNAGMD